ncbi:acyl-CoA dehydrogenase FadE [Aeromonas salmonicida subsp. salmonicida]|uniref:acyl-CoA dehydrogenase FadE n=1 Tax=Aeromonas salmonicida TaxID=645 RepID=UPI003FD0FD25
MTTTLTLLGVILVIGAMAYRRASLFTSTLATAAALVAGTLYGNVPLLVWALFAMVAIPLNLVDFRRNQLTKPLFKIYKSIMPEMSRTEKEAIEAGTTWWEADLFAGNPNWKKLHAIPVSVLSTEEQAFMDGPVENVCRMVNDWEVTHERADLSPEVWQYLKDNKFFAMIIKKKYGGLDFYAYAQSCVLQKLCAASPVLASTVGVPNTRGPCALLQPHGTEEQKYPYLPRLAVGKEIPCFALTSPEAGSDAGSIPDFGIICKGEWEGEEVLGMRLTWNKRYITLAPIATVLGLAFKLRDPDHLLGDEEELGITCALIPTHIKGVEIGRRHFPLNVPFQNGPTRGDNVFVPLDFIIGGPAMAGQGWRMLVECLSVGRGITLPSNSTGGVKMLALATGAYSRIRRQFKLPIGKMEGIEEPLARLGGNAYIMGAAANLTVTGIDLGEKPSVISAIVKYHLTDRAQKCIIDAMDIHGGKAICMGPNNYLARGYQGAPIAVTVEGANILTRSMIIYGQGAIRCHPYVLPEMLAASHPDKEQALKDFDKAMFSHVGFAISNLVRSFWLGLTGARFAAAPYKDQTKGYYQQLSRLSANLAFLSDMAMGTLGGELKRKERVSARLGDVLSQLYLASSALKRYQDEGRQQADLPLLHWALQDAMFKAQEAIDELLRNFPNRWIGLALRVIVLPLGRDMKRPSDKLDQQVARLLQTPSETRSRLAQGQYLTREEGNPFGLLEQALDDVLAAEPLFDKVCKADGIKRLFMQLDKVADAGLALGVLNQNEADLLRRAEESRLRTINVDDFDPIDLVANKTLFEPSAYHRAA